MPSSTGDRITAAADRLIYERGFEATSVADVAAASGLSKGNLTYHFASKDALLGAVLAARAEEKRRLLAGWEADAGPRERIGRYLDIVLTNALDIERFGCPVGTLTSELLKSEHPLHGDAVAIFEIFRCWLREQFTALGHGRDADDHALHVLMASQGIAVLSQAYRDHEFVVREVARLHAWLDDLTPTT